MKILSILILSILLLTAESFATVSLHPPMVFAEKEDRSMAATEEVAKSTNGMVYLARFFSVYLFIGGLFVTAFDGAVLSSDSDTANKSGAKIGAAVGLGIMTLGAFCIYWSF